MCKCHVCLRKNYKVCSEGFFFIPNTARVIINKEDDHCGIFLLQVVFFNGIPSIQGLRQSPPLHDIHRNVRWR